MKLLQAIIVCDSFFAMAADAAEPPAQKPLVLGVQLYLLRQEIISHARKWTDLHAWEGNHCPAGQPVHTLNDLD